MNFGGARLKGLTCECAWGVARKKDAYSSKFHWRARVRRGSQKAIATAARKMPALIRFMTKGDEAYGGERFDKAKEKHEISRKRKLIIEAGKLGFHLAPAGSDAVEAQAIQTAKHRSRHILAAAFMFYSHAFLNAIFVVLCY
ncbi:MAG: hypothetical protein LBU32_13850 [Clostridiales bacterium]|jgi:hypothetical protein|nr:hypothetical protein [Clostridiales bacterium]